MNCNARGPSTGFRALWHLDASAIGYGRPHAAATFPLAAFDNTRIVRPLSFGLVPEEPESLRRGPDRLKRNAGFGLHQIKKLTDSQVFFQVRLFNGRDRTRIIYLQELADPLIGLVAEMHRQHRPRKFGVQVRAIGSDNVRENVRFSNSIGSIHAPILPRIAFLQNKNKGNCSLSTRTPYFPGCFISHSSVM
jgi:hypothetical protein